MTRYARIAVEAALALGVLALFVGAFQALGQPDWGWALGPALLGAVFGVLWVADALLPGREEA